MDEQQIRALIRQEIQAGDSSSRFQLHPIQRHIHNNVDSPFVFQPIATYIGIVVWNGVSLLGATLPKGWSVSRQNVGKYTVTHNLGASVIYVVNAAANQSTNELATPVFTYLPDSFSVVWGGGAAGDVSFSFTDTSFSFVLTVINNRSTQLPSYTT